LSDDDAVDSSGNDVILAVANAQGGGLIKFAAANTTTSLTDPATATIGSNSDVSAALGTVLVYSETGTAADGQAVSNGGGLGVDDSSQADTTVVSAAATNVLSGASLSGDAVDVFA